MTIPGQWHNDAIPAKKPNETEIVEFSLGEHVCGVDVAQVREIIRTAGGVVPVAGPHPSIGGVVNLRGKIIPVIDLAKHFHIPESGDLKKKRVIVSEFYRFRVGFLVHQVTRILRISSPHGAFGRLTIESPSQPPRPWGNYFKGTAHSDGRTISLLDFEQIALDIHPVDRTRPQARTSLPIPRVDFDRSTRKILVVEDSAFMRQLIARYLKQSGYNVLTVSNGFEAWEILEDILRSPDFKDITQHYHLVLSDIEMPRMDGLELIRKIKEHPALKKLPCVVFSGSLVDDLPGKCQAAGVDAQISKDDIELLIRLLDSKVLP
jgi:two-component system chemotaxis response regulator CheV